MFIPRDIIIVLIKKYQSSSTHDERSQVNRKYLALSENVFSLPVPSDHETDCLRMR